jgi:hypothetical protein
LNCIVAWRAGLMESRVHSGAFGVTI